MGKKTIAVDEVYKALMEENGEVIYDLRDKTITGKLDLKHHSIKKAVYIQDCVFIDEIDLSYCEFKQPVYLSGTHFAEALTSEGTVFEGNLECKNAVFKGGVNFQDVKCTGNGLFKDTQFANEKRTVDFLNATFGGNLECDRAVFKGGVRFQGINCTGHGLFRDTQFENEEKLVDFLNAAFGGDLTCDRAVFKGGVLFEGVKCNGHGFFQDAKFENEKKLVNFLDATFGENLECDKAIFRCGVRFQGIKCTGSGLFRDTKFKNKEQLVDFLNATFSGNLECDKAVFKGGVRFQGINCTGHGLFRDTKFENEKKTVDFSFASFNANLEFKNNIFQQNLDLNGTSIKRLSLKSISFYQNGEDSKKKVDLRGCVIENFIGTREDNLKFLDAQRPKHFSREPYIQLEKYYLKIGDETEAKRIFLKGRDAVRRNAVIKGTSIHWSWTKIVGDWFLNLSVRYGTQTWRLLIPIFILLAVGFYIHWADDTLTIKDDLAITAQTFGQKLIYLIDLLIPINLHIAEKWQLNSLSGEVYAIFLTIFGWLLVPLLVASLGGILRRQ